MTYSENITENKNLYPFERWKEAFSEFGLEQYTDKNCAKAKSIMDSLIADMITIGESAPIDKKMGVIEKAVLKYNELSEEINDLIETEEREDLAQVINNIAVTAGIDIEQFDNDITGEWREW